MKGVLLVNTGSPQTMDRKGVKDFVRAMLSDPMVLTVPDWFRPILVKGFILPFRQFSSTKKYSLIWDNKHKSSPLMYHMQLLAQKLEEKSQMPVEIAMRYNEPDISKAFQRLVDKGSNIDEVVVVPLFPQYAESSWQTAVDEVEAKFSEKEYSFRITFVKPYFDHPCYIDALCESLKPFIDQKYDMLLFNFHSLPITHVEKGWEKGKEFDYVYQLKETVKLVQKKLNLDMNANRIVYSSAMSGKWIRPSLDETMGLLGQSDKKNIVVISPGFAVDNLETLYDIKINARNIFFKHGGKRLAYVPCLNSEDYWVEALIRIIAQ